MIPWESIVEAGKRAKEEGHLKVFVQLPEGVIPWAKRVYQLLKNLGLNPVICVEPTYGACDIKEWKARTLGCTAIIHVGHEKIPCIREGIPVYYAPLRYSILDEDLILRACSSVEARRIGLVATIQYSHLLERVKEKIEEAGLEAKIGQGDGRILERGQVLGCNVSTAEEIADEVDVFFFYGDGSFHAIAVRGVTGKRTYVLDPIRSEIRDVEEEFTEMWKRRMLAIGEASNCQSFGVFVTSKIGQYSESALEKVLSCLERNEREYSVFHLEDFSERVNYLKGIEAIVFIGCPRVAYDEGPRFKLPVITPTELEIALGEKKPDEWKFEEIRCRAKQISRSCFLESLKFRDQRRGQNSTRRLPTSPQRSCTSRGCKETCWEKGWQTSEPALEPSPLEPLS